jgi:hypothetical protein
MIKVVKELFDDFRERAEVFTPIQGDILARVKIDIEEVEHLAMSEGAMIDLGRTAALLRRTIQVPVSSDEEVIQKEMMGILGKITLIATAFKQYFTSVR